MLSHKDIKINIGGKKYIYLDVFFSKNKKLTPIVFSHGFKGFKNWGFFDEISEYFAENSCLFVKFNFSCNGVKMSEDYFSDLESFSENNLSKELDELGFVIDWLSSSVYKDLIDLNNLTLIGHSRGGGISILKSSEDERVKRLVTWGSVYDFYSRPLFLRKDKCKQKGYMEIFNTRTKQNMPIKYQFFEDLDSNYKRLSIKDNFKNNINTLIIHGEEDKSIPVEEALDFSSLFNLKCEVIKRAGHTFDAKHPKQSHMPDNLVEVIEKTLKFIKS